jgi:hypothetical protein
MKKNETKHRNYSILRKLKNERKINEELEILLSGLSLEDLIALKLEIAAKPAGGKLYGIPLWKSTQYIVKDALLKFAISACKTHKDAASLLGIEVATLRESIRKYQIYDFFEKK